MTSDERLTIITSLASKHLKANAKTRASARQALIREGIYNASGDLSANYGGEAGPKPSRSKKAEA